jgi:hypothetical protein
MLAAIDTGALLKVVWFSLAAGTAISATYAIGVYGYTRFTELHHAGQSTSALPYAALAAVSFAVFIGAVVAGFIVMTKK